VTRPEIDRRRRRARLMTALTSVAAGVALLPLVLILGHLVLRGAAALAPAMTAHGAPVTGRAGGGLASAVAGTLLLLAIAAGVGLPVGIGAGLYLAELRTTPLARTVRYLADVLSGVPSIIVGVVVWQFVVRPSGHFSAWAGGIALGVIMIPLVTRATEAALLAVPLALREAALALGYPRWRAALAVGLRTALPGIVTGALVAVARVAGETAPLLLTAFGNQYWSLRPAEPVAALPLTIFTYGISPYDAWRRQAWAASLVLIALVVVIGAATRLAAGRRRAL
jgi:phosphate transport system permease protein